MATSTTSLWCRQPEGSCREEERQGRCCGHVLNRGVLASLLTWHSILRATHAACTHAACPQFEGANDKQYIVVRDADIMAQLA